MKNAFVYFVGEEWAKGRNGEVLAKGLAVMRVGKTTPVAHICPILRNGKISNSATLPLPDNKRGELAGALLGTTRDMGELFEALVSGAECSCSLVTGPIKVVSVGLEKSQVTNNDGFTLTVPTHTIYVPWPAG